jgi:hypothetical protein
MAVLQALLGYTNEARWIREDVPTGVEFG